MVDANTSVEDNHGEARQEFINALHLLLKGQQASTRMRCAGVRACARTGAVVSQTQRQQDIATRELLVDLLLDTDTDVRMEAASALGALNFAEAVEPLLKNIAGDPNGDVRIQAVTALAKIRSKTAVKPLIACIREDGYPELDLVVDDLEFGTCWEVQSLALHALGEIGDPQAAGAVIELIKNDDYEDLQETGYQVLARLDSDAARRFLVAQLRDGNALTRRRAVHAIAALPELGASTKEPPMEVLSALTEALLDEDEDVRIAAAMGLRSTRNPLVATSLTMLLSDRSPNVRREVATILSTMRSGEILDRLHGMLDEHDVDVKCRVVCILGEIGDPTSAEFVAPLLDTKIERLLYDAVRTVGQIGQPGTEDRLAELLADQSNHATLRFQAALALGSVLVNMPGADQVAGTQGSADEGEAAEDFEEDGEDQGADAISKLRFLHDTLLVATFDENEQVAFAALSALVAADPENASLLLVNILRGDTLQQLLDQAATAEEASETEADRQELERETHIDPSDEISVGGDPKTSTLASILARQHEEAQNAPEDVAQDIDDASDHEKAGEPVRVHAATLLGGMTTHDLSANDDGEALATLMEVAGQGEGDVQRQAIIALGQVGGEQALPVILQALDADQREIRLAALDALQRSTATADIEERLVKMLGDPDPMVREQTLKALAAAQGTNLGSHVTAALDDTDLAVCRVALSVLPVQARDCELRRKVIETAFRFEGNLRREAGIALRGVADTAFVSPLLATLSDPELEDRHWILIDTLAELFAEALPATNLEGNGLA